MKDLNCFSEPEAPLPFPAQLSLAPNFKIPGTTWPPPASLDAIVQLQQWRMKQAEQQLRSQQLQAKFPNITEQQSLVITSEQEHYASQSRRARRRRPGARRSLQSVFDMAAGKANDGCSDDSDIDMLWGQNKPPTPSNVDSYARTNMYKDCREGHPEQPLLNINVVLSHFFLSDRCQLLSLDEVRAIILGVTHDLSRIHSRGVPHARIHPSAIEVLRGRGDAVCSAQLLMEAGGGLEARGSAICVGSKGSGRKAYVPPEIAVCNQGSAVYTPAGDMWGLGVILFQLLAGLDLPFGYTGVNLAQKESIDALQKWLDNYLSQQIDSANKCHIQQQNTISACITARVLGFDSQSAQLVKSLLRADPAQRPSAEKIMANEWLNPGIIVATQEYSDLPSDEVFDEALLEGNTVAVTHDDMAAFSFAAPDTPSEKSATLHRHYSQDSISDERASLLASVTSIDGLPMDSECPEGFLPAPAEQPPPGLLLPPGAPQIAPPPGAVVVGYLLNFHNLLVCGQSMEVQAMHAVYKIEGRHYVALAPSRVSNEDMRCQAFEASQLKNR